MYESYEKKMEKINSSLERLLEEASIDYETLILQSEKLKTMLVFFSVTSSTHLPPVN